MSPRDPRLQRLIDSVLEDFKIGRNAVRSRLNYPHSYTIPFLLELAESFQIHLPQYARWSKGRGSRPVDNEYSEVLEAVLDGLFK